MAAKKHTLLAQSVLVMLKLYNARTIIPGVLCMTKNAVQCICPMQEKATTVLMHNGQTNALGTHCIGLNDTLAPLKTN